MELLQKKEVFTGQKKPYTLVKEVDLIKTFHLQLFAEDDVNRTTDNVPGNDLSPTMKEFYDTELLENAREELYFTQFGKKTPLPENHGETVEWRGFMPFKPAMKPLEEGVTPKGNKLSMRKIKKEIAQYGDYSRISDRLELHAVDDVILGATEEHGAQAGLTLDMVTRNEVMVGTSVLYAPGKNGVVESRHKLDGSCLLTSKLVNMAATFLKKMKAPKIDGSWVGLVHPSNSEDLRESEGWIDVHKYADPETIFQGEIGKLHGVRFVESNLVKVYRGADLAEDARNLSVNGAVSSAQNYVTFDGGTVEADALKGRYILLGDKKFYVISNDASKIYLGDAITHMETTVNGITDNTVIYPGEGGAEGCAVYGTIFMGKDAYGVIDPEGAGLEMIVKDRKTAGGPLNQTSTVGWKAETAAKILYEERMLRVECGSSYSDVDEEN